MQSLKLAILIFITITLNQAAYSEVLSKPCPYDCLKAGYSKSNCKDYRIGNTCYLDLQQAATRKMILCLRSSDGTLRARNNCRQNEERVNLSSLIGETGPQGEKGEQGLQGTDGTLRVYGDGSAGSVNYSISSTFQESNPQFTDFTIANGVTLTVPSGTILRCSGNFINNGTINVSVGLRDTPRFAENGRTSSLINSSPQESPGGAGGQALPLGVAKQYLRTQISAAGNGFREAVDSGSDGAGSLTIICSGAIVNNGTITSDGMNSASQYRGGGGGGLIVLASGTSINNNGTISANGGNGGDFLATDANNTGHGPGGGGGGGIAHLVSPTIGNTGTILVNGGQGGTAGGAMSITGFIYSGGGGGGGSGGAGGNGGAVNPGNSGLENTAAGEDGEPGQILQTIADPVSLF